MGRKGSNAVEELMDCPVPQDTAEGSESRGLKKVKTQWE